jgi:carboxyl-terminal processing protease
VAKNAVVSQNLRYMDKNRKKLLKQYPSFQLFKEQFEVPQSLIDDVLREGEKQKVKPKDDEELQRTLPTLRLQLKALIARDLWDMSEYYSIFYEDSEIVKKALELLK